MVFTNASRKKRLTMGRNLRARVRPCSNKSDEDDDVDDDGGDGDDDGDESNINVPFPVCLLEIGS